MLDDDENSIKEMGEKLFSRLNSSVLYSVENRNFENDPKEANFLIQNLIESINESAANISKDVDKSIDKPFVDKLAKMYEDAKFRYDPFIDTMQVSNISEEMGSSDMIVAKQIKTIDDRNTEAAIQSMELAFLYCENVMSHYIESGAKSLETVIPALHSKLSSSRAEFGESHHSLQLLDAAISTDYCVMRDGYVALLKKYYSESAAQLAVTSKLETQTNSWHDAKLKEIIAKSNNSQSQSREQSLRVMRDMNDLFSGACDATFAHLLRNNNFTDVEESIQALQDIKDCAYKWKASIVKHTEETLNGAVVALDDVYQSHLEELTGRLACLRVSASEMYLYQTRLEHNSVVLRNLIAREESKRRKTQGKLSVSRYEHFRSPHEEAQHREEDRVIVHKAAIQDNSLRMGTRLHALALSAGMSEEEVEALLMSTLPFQSR